MNVILYTIASPWIGWGLPSSTGTKYPFPLHELTNYMVHSPRQTVPPVKKLPAFHDRSQQPASCHSPEPDSLDSCPPIVLHSRTILILSYYHGIGPPSGLFLWGFPTKTLHAGLFSTIRVICTTLSCSFTILHWKWSWFLRDDGTYLPDYTASNPIRQQSSICLYVTCYYIFLLTICILESSLLCDFTHRRFGTTYRSYLTESLEDSIDRLFRNVDNYLSTLRKIAQEWRSQTHGGGSFKLRTFNAS
jgi:hypothetical protein